MRQSKTGNRVVVIGGPAPAAEKAVLREPASQHVTSRRIVVIKNGQFVGRPGR